MLLLVLIHVQSIRYKYVSLPLTRDTLLFSLTNGWSELVRRVDQTVILAWGHAPPHHVTLFVVLIRLSKRVMSHAILVFNHNTSANCRDASFRERIMNHM